MKSILPASLTILILLASSCKENENSILRDVPYNGTKLTEINLDNIPPEVKEYKLSELFSDFQTIPLETKAECVIGNTKIQFSKDFIFVGTQNFPGAAKLYRFSKDGRFINEIGKEGRGPGEHQGYMPPHLIVFEKDSLMLVNWEGAEENAQFFSFRGAFSGEVVSPMELLSDIYYWSDNEWFCFGNCAGKPEFQRDSCKLVFFNNQGKILKIIPRLKYPDAKTEDYSPYGSQESIYRFNNQLKVYTAGIDTIFKLADRRLVPTEILNRGKNGMPYNSVMAPEQLAGKFDLSILAETENNLILQKHIIKSAKTKQYKPGKWSVLIVPEYQLIIIDKKSRNATYAKLKDDVFQFLPDDFLNRNPEWGDDRSVTISLQAMYYQKIIKESVSADSLSGEAVIHRNKLKEITENSNPVILTFKLKDKIRIN